MKFLPDRLSEDEFNELFLEATKMVYNIGLRLNRNNREDAMDFVQEVYLHARSKRRSFKGDSKFSTWLYRVALNLGLNRISKDKKLKNDLRDIADLPEENLSDVNDTPEEALLNDSMSAVIRETISELPEAYRLPIMLYYFEKMPYSEIAQALNIKEGTLKSNISRGKTLMKKLLKGKGYE